MRHVTVETVLRNRRMFHDVRPSLFSMAFITQFIDGVGLDHLWSKASMRDMATETWSFTFLYRVSGLLHSLGPNVLVTLEAKVGNRCFQILLLGCEITNLAGYRCSCIHMNQVTRVARDAGGFVSAQIPESHFIGVGMTGETFGRFQFWIVAFGE